MLHGSGRRRDRHGRLGRRIARIIPERSGRCPRRIILAFAGQAHAALGVRFLARGPFLSECPAGTETTQWQIVGQHHGRARASQRRLFRSQPGVALSQVPREVQAAGDGRGCYAATRQPTPGFPGRKGPSHSSRGGKLGCTFHRHGGPDCCPTTVSVRGYPNIDRTSNLTKSKMISFRMRTSRAGGLCGSEARRHRTFRGLYSRNALYNSRLRDYSLQSIGFESKGLSPHFLRLDRHPLCWTVSRRYQASVLDFSEEGNREGPLSDPVRPLASNAAFG